MTWRVTSKWFIRKCAQEKNVDESWGGREAIDSEKESHAKVAWEGVSYEGNYDGRPPTHPGFKSSLEVLTIELYCGYTLLQQLNIKWNQKKESTWDKARRKRAIYFEGPSLRGVPQDTFHFYITGIVTNCGCCQTRKPIRDQSLPSTYPNSKCPKKCRYLGSTTWFVLKN